MTRILPTLRAAVPAILALIAAEAVISIAARWPHDALQADEGDQGKTTGDRLLDWNGIYNLYLVCGGAYGAGKVLNKADPSTVVFLQSLAADTGAVGAGELALISSGAETHPGYAGAPGHFTCETG